MIQSVAGPVPLFVSLGTSSAPLLLGVCEDVVNVMIEPRFTPAMASIGGTEIPHDEIYQGAIGGLTGVLTVFNWQVYLKCLARPKAGTSVLGVADYGDIGTLMVAEGANFITWAQFPYVSKTFFSGNDMIGGVRFLSTHLRGPDQIGAHTSNFRIPISFHAMRKYVQTNTTFGSTVVNAGGSILFDTDMSALPATLPTTKTGVIS